eukprot:2358405-Prymnesium_polylepis.1
MRVEGEGRALTDDHHAIEEQRDEDDPHAADEDERHIDRGAGALVDAFAQHRAQVDAREDRVGRARRVDDHEDEVDVTV